MGGNGVAPINPAARLIPSLAPQWHRTMVARQASRTSGCQPSGGGYKPRTPPQGAGNLTSRAGQALGELGQQRWRQRWRRYGKGGRANLEHGTEVLHFNGGGRRRRFRSCPVLAFRAPPLVHRPALRRWAVRQTHAHIQYTILRCTPCWVFRGGCGSGAKGSPRQERLEAGRPAS